MIEAILYLARHTIMLADNLLTEWNGAKSGSEPDITSCQV